MKILPHSFFSKIRRPTRLYGNSHNLIDNVYSNNLCKSHIFGILTYQISDHFMTFSIVEGNNLQINNLVKYVEVQDINLSSINNFKNSITRSDLHSQLDLNQASPEVTIEMRPNFSGWAAKSNRSAPFDLPYISHHFSSPDRRAISQMNGKLAINIL